MRLSRVGAMAAALLLTIALITMVLPRAGPDAYDTQVAVTTVPEMDVGTVSNEGIAFKNESFYTVSPQHQRNGTRTFRITAEDRYGGTLQSGTPTTTVLLL